jgi:hypothetical protein
MHTGLVVGAVAAAVGVVVTLLWLPARTRSTDLATQTLDFDEQHMAATAPLATETSR